MGEWDGKVVSFDAGLGLGYSVGVCVWDQANKAPTQHTFAIEGYFDPSCKHSKKIGTIHLGRDYLSVLTMVHEVYHAIDELRRRTETISTRRGKAWRRSEKEEWLAQRFEALLKKIILELECHGEEVTGPH